MKRLYFTILSLLGFLSNIWADSIFVASGIAYKKVDENTVIVCAKDNNIYVQAFKDSTLNIPASIIYEKKKFKVRGIGPGAFATWHGIKHVHISNGVEEIQKSAFQACANLEDIFIPSTVRTIDDYILSFCLNLSTIKVDKDNVFFDSREGCNAIIKKKGNALLYGCKNTKIPSSVERIESFAFYGCHIESICIPNGVKRIMDNAFCDCPFLKHISISSTVEWIEGTSFANCRNITSISVDKENPVYDSRENCNAIIDKDAEMLVLGCSNTTMPSGVSVIGESAFSEVANLHSLNIPEGITTIYGNAFRRCSALKNIKFPSSLRYFKGHDHFGDCVSLDSIVIPQNVETLPNTIFRGCVSLQTMEVDPKNVTYDSRNKCNAIIRTENDMLVAGCTGSVIAEGVKFIDENAFYGSGITSVYIPASVIEIDSTAFRACKYCKAITVSPNNKKYESNGTNSIVDKKHCKLVLACSTSTISHKVTSIGSFAFVNTHDVLILPSGIRRIEDYAFANCNDLNWIFIPSTVQHIGRFAFGSCKQLHHAIIMGNNVNIDKEAFKGCRHMVLQ